MTRPRCGPASVADRRATDGGHGIERALADARPMAVASVDIAGLAGQAVASCAALLLNVAVTGTILESGDEMLLQLALRYHIGTPPYPMPTPLPPVSEAPLSGDLRQALQSSYLSGLAAAHPRIRHGWPAGCGLGHCRRATGQWLLCDPRRLLYRLLSKLLIQKAKKISGPCGRPPAPLFTSAMWSRAGIQGRGRSGTSMLSAQQHRRPQVPTPLFACIRARAPPLRRAAEPRPPMLLQSGVRARPRAARRTSPPHCCAVDRIHCAHWQQQMTRSRVGPVAYCCERRFWGALS